jgi:predicted dehydrogenase
MKELNFGLLGFGYFGKHYAQILQQMSGVSLRAVFSPSFAEGKSTELPNSVLQINDAEKLLNDPLIDCVIIATPPSTHLSLLRSAIREKKHILLEKPAVSRGSEIGEFESVLENNKKCFMVGHIYFYNDYLRQIKKTIDCGLLGNIRHISFNQAGRGPIRTDVDCLWEIGAHHISIVEYLFGPMWPIHVQGTASSMIPGGRYDFVSAELGYPNGISVDIKTSWFMPLKERLIKIIGDKGSVVFDDIKKTLFFFRLEYPHKEKNLKKFSIWLDDGSEEGTPLIQQSEVRNPQQNELEHFIHCVQTGEKPQTGADHAIRIVKILDFVSKNTSRAK